MRIRVLKEFLGVPSGEIGDVVHEGAPNSPHHIMIKVKFPSKSEVVMISVPNSSLEVLPGRTVNEV